MTLGLLHGYDWIACWRSCKTCPIRNMPYSSALQHGAQNCRSSYVSVYRRAAKKCSQGTLSSYSNTLEHQLVAIGKLDIWYGDAVTFKPEKNLLKPTSIPTTGREEDVFLGWSDLTSEEIEVSVWIQFRPLSILGDLGGHSNRITRVTQKSN